MTKNDEKELTEEDILLMLKEFYMEGLLEGITHERGICDGAEIEILEQYISNSKVMQNKFDRFVRWYLYKRYEP